jgi:hypothetical protein
MQSLTLHPGQPDPDRQGTAHPSSTLTITINCRTAQGSLSLPARWHRQDGE